MSNDSNNNQSIIEHLEEFRGTLFKCIIAIVIIFPFVFYFSSEILDVLSNLIIGNSNIKLNYFSPMEVFLLKLKLSLLTDVIICYPYIVNNLWNFILPALYENEKKFVGSIVLISSFLFAAGILFCLFVIVPMVINFGISISGKEFQAVLGVSNIFNLTLNMALVFGLMFQIPLIVHMLIKYNIITYDHASNIRPYVVIILLIFSAILTPPDIISQIMLFMPTYILFELGLLFSKTIK